jgi:plasmid stabilization system protein ParE
VKPPIFRPAAAADVEDAYLWYENQRAGLGEDFLAAVSRVIESLLTYPKRFPVGYRETRRVNLRRFPYSLFYRIIDELGRMLLEELASERRWEELFAGSHDLLAELADEALAEHRAGRTEKVDPEKL